MRIFLKIHVDKFFLVTLWGKPTPDCSLRPQFLGKIQKNKGEEKGNVVDVT